jgi:hypothetical protein
MTKPQVSIGKCDLCANEAVYLYTRGGGTSFKRCVIHAGTVRDWSDLKSQHPARGPQEQRG